MQLRIQFETFSDIALPWDMSVLITDWDSGCTEAILNGWFHMIGGERVRCRVEKKPTIWQNDLPIHIPDIPCVCSRWFFTFYHGKSPLNHHVGNNFSQPPWANLRYHGNCTTSVVIFRNFWPKKAQINRQCFCWDHVGICWDVFFPNSVSFASFVAIFVPVKNQGSFQCFDIYANESLRPLWGAHANLRMNWCVFEMQPHAKKITAPCIWQGSLLN